MTIFKHRDWRRVAAALLLGVLAACSDSDGGGNSPTSPSGGPGPSGAIITIGASGTLTPAAVTIAPGQSVTFVNNHTVTHDMASDPHPAHTACPSINALGNLPVGATKLTNSFTAAASCTFHDHNDPTNASLQGSITIR